MKVYEIPLRFVKAFLIVTDNGSILVDCGIQGSGERIINAITKINKKLEEVKYVVFTHSHGDHIGGAYEVRKVLDRAKFGIDKNGVKYLERGEIREPVLHSLIMKTFFAIGKPFLFKKLNPVRVDFELNEGELVDGVEIIKTPGHTDDSVSIYLPSINSVIVGDLLQGTKEGLKYPSIYEDFNELQKSVEKIKSLKPSMVYVSHGISSSKFLV
ncbi:MBL fold metallo-hydrolase [Sulfolobus sp. A20]|uniref:MBL fold metallo-hydrolase n=1 Tax=Sulfolobaceae TaxID=118883 RepID=UPI00084623BC|nr:MULTISPECIES: MBL fold metallo-hydrolase [unclassified Sulfolobus]TRM75364.1 MBL fold metallo-hydrolase [Sulfolobus sp. E5]TRM76078.1 MBL fold metallo-hydrolase [Sulfolobus sp. A20-N-F8]TRM79429.1 MBL fold metallo-hydrolase [Sulfolobus sp. B5]TRM81255.1 MBL fold metallo-hydrolase [Sulfolobus sp. D5]TRM83706.1 MBL fold metallo-hydrolase [Sulfolobus sp. F3]TRM88553.1 MBL fold metallo-hydrolase [Sulfolobus sp. C3]TRM89120.1 MBL fold metallo-hydrolase [Sulfolobus sp. E3]TRM94814.1 MBL fold m